MSPQGERLSSRDRGRRQEVLRIIKGDRLDEDAPTRFAVALVLVLCRPDVSRAAKIADVGIEEAELFASRLRESRMIHGDRLDMSSFWSGFSGKARRGNGPAVNMALIALVCAGKLTKRKPCKHCGKSVARAGYQENGVQRWRCIPCDKEFVYERNPIERMKAPWEELAKAVGLTEKGKPPALVASRTGLSLVQAKKIARLIGEGHRLRTDRCAMYGPGSSKRATKWSPDAIDLHGVIEPKKGNAP